MSFPITTAGYNLCVAADAFAQAALIGSTGGNSVSDSGKAVLFDGSGCITGTAQIISNASNYADYIAGTADGVGRAILQANGIGLSSFVAGVESIGVLSATNLSGQRVWTLPDLGGTLLLDANIGSSVQAFSMTLLAVANGTYTGSVSITTLGPIANGTWNATAIAVAKGGTGATDAATARTNLGLGTLSTQAASAVAITGGSITGLTQFGVSMANNTAMTGFALGTISDTTARPFTVSQTLNNASLAATVLKVSATVTSASATSKLLDLCAGAAGTTSVFSVLSSGNVQLAGGSTIAASTDSGLSIQPSPTTAMMYLSWITGTVQLQNSTLLTFGPNATANNYDLMLGRRAAASLRLGVDSATPVNQTIGACSGSGSNITGANFTITPGNGTGTGGSGKLIFRTAPAGSSGSTANTMATALEIDKDRVLFVADTNAAPSGTPSGGGYFYVESGALKFKGSSGTVTTLAAA